jgi:hypothetical protein
MEACRVVEDQYKSVTRRLVDSIAEHDVLEQALEQTKPSYPTSDDPRPLHFLLSTPFRYPPLRYGSRFGSRAYKGIWYGALSERTALAETAYYRFRLLNDTKADVNLQTDFALFWTAIETSKGVDLTSKRFEPARAEITDKSSYVRTQQLGKDMRDSGVVGFKFPSARDRQGGVNVGLFSSSAFKKPTISNSDFETWHCFGTRAQFEFQKKSFSQPERFVFPRTEFEVRGKLPVPK